MGAIVQAQNEIQRGGGSTFKDLVQKCAPQFASVMPRGLKPERLIQMSIAAYKTTPKLSECSVSSILSCCLQCATLGLEPSAVDGLGRAYILPRWNNKTKSYEATFQLGKNGVIELARRSGQIKSIRTQVVREKDSFNYWEDETGVHFNFRPDYSENSGQLRLVYLTCHLKDGGFVFLAMTKSEIDEVKSRTTSKDRNGNIIGPWRDNYEAMAEKTVIRRAFNRGMLPFSVEVSKAVAQDETTPVILDEDGYEVFGKMPEAEEVENVTVDPETGEVSEKKEEQDA